MSGGGRRRELGVGAVVVAAAAAVAAAACGAPAGAQGAAGPARPGQGSGGSGQGELSAEELCVRMANADARCPEFDLRTIDHASCVEAFLASPHPAHPLRCFGVETRCDRLVACFAAAAEPPTELRACDDDRRGHRVGVPAAEWQRRPGARATTFADARSTKAAPIEMCGINDAYVWLSTLRCNDGSAPLSSRDDAAGSRSGNVGPGGRCGSIIDRYVVLCPEARYEIFIDAYVCALPGS